MSRAVLRQERAVHSAPRSSLLVAACLLLSGPALPGARAAEANLTSSGTDQHPAWSPDGATILFDSRQSGNVDIWTIPATGGTASRLTGNRKTDEAPDWSPDGTQYTFAAVQGGSPNLYVRSTGGGTPTLLDSDPANAITLPSWSPDGSAIAYVKGTDLWIIPSAGGTPVQLTTDPASDTHPSWSPDGTQIAFQSNRGGNIDVWVIPSAGGAAARITTDASPDGAPDWSPDGTQLAIQSQRSGNNDIWLIPAAGGTATQVTTDAGSDTQPDWAPDGSAIAFSRDGALWTVTVSAPAPSADLTVTKTVDNATPAETDTVVYTVTLTNNGPDDATGVEVTDLLPAGVTYVSGAPAQGTYDGGTGLWTVGSVAGSASTTLAITATVDAGTGGSTVTNTAAVTASDLADPNAANDSASAGITVGAPSGWHFTDVTAAAGVSVSHGVSNLTTPQRKMSAGAAAGDYDGDGWLDLYFLGGDTGQNHLFRNNGDGTFADVTAAAGVALAGTFGMGPCFADWDGDGDLDLFVGRIEGTPTLFRNNGDGTFTDATGSSGVTIMNDTFSTSFGDHDNDGDLDLFTAHWSPPMGGNVEGPGHIWQNDGTGFFTEVDSLVGYFGYSLPTTFYDHTFVLNLADINNDGWRDLVVSADFQSSHVFLNDGDGTFTNTTDALVITDDNGMGCTVGDYDNDGDLDWFVSSILDSTASHTGNRLYQNDGTGTFTDVTTTAGVRDGQWGWGASFQDFNNDGWLDLYHVNGWHNPPFTTNTSRMFVSNQDGTFSEMSSSLGVATPGQGRGLVCFDYDRDGDVDMFVANNDSLAVLYRNDGPGGNWLDVKLVGGAANTEEIGGRVVATTGSLNQMRELRAGSNFLSQDPAEAHFGIGTASVVDQLDVQWTDGSVTTMTNVAVNQRIVVTQVSGADLAVTKTVDDASPAEGAAIVYTVTVSNGGPEDATGVEVTDALPAGVTFVSAAAGQGSYASGTGLWTVGGLVNGASATLDLTATVDAGTAGATITNGAAVTAVDQTDANAANDAASAGITVAGGAVVLTQIGTGGVDDRRPAWSPDGTTIAFDSHRVRNRDVWLLPATGGAATQFTFNKKADVHPDWSPDGTTVVFSAVQSTSLDLYVRASGGGPITPIHQDAAAADRLPSWSPDGTTIAFEKSGDLYLVPAAGGTATQLTTDPGGDSHPTWSPDGTQIAFSSDRSGDQEVWILPSAGGTPAQLTNDPAADEAPDWSPDGTLIAFHSDRDGNSDIWTVPAAGGTAVKVSDDAGVDTEPDWSPDGLQIVFARDGDIWTATFPVAPAPLVREFAGNAGAPASGAPAVAWTPTEFSLSAARPNPFRVGTSFRFDIPRSAVTEVEIFDVTGRRVRTLVKGPLAPGRFDATWDGRDGSGGRAAPGVYLVRLRAGSFQAVRKAVLLQ